MMLYIIVEPADIDATKFEIHRADCRHVGISGKWIGKPWPIEAESAEQAILLDKRDDETTDDYTIAPCARGKL